MGHQCPIPLLPLERSRRQELYKLTRRLIKSRQSKRGRAADWSERRVKESPVPDGETLIPLKIVNDQLA
ncbi:hypothetical protein CJD35_16120 [Sphingobium xenophagum]|uniref:Uncharacterized protein n=1 Tax=Sphingobium xenophagum TaxID=121428 RepID=A0A249MXD9_SPHXE|nr:hypothetical protein CJD35_16120 [Sphingobium xenophagum]